MGARPDQVDTSACSSSKRRRAAIREPLFASGRAAARAGAVRQFARTITCPLRRTFELTSGKVLRGPATEPVPAYETRVIDGVVEIRGR
jgi:hypothetical protein